MVCPYCGFETKVVNSRSQKRSNQIWRRRQCKRCSNVFTTEEAIDLTKSVTVLRGASGGPFLPDLLYTEVLLAMQDRKNNYSEAREVTNTIIQKLLKEPEGYLLQTVDISRTCADVLKRFDRRAWLRYVADHPSLQS